MENCLCDVHKPLMWSLKGCWLLFLGCGHRGVMGSQPRHSYPLSLSGVERGLMSPNTHIAAKLWHHHKESNDSFIKFDLIRQEKLNHYMT